MEKNSHQILLVQNECVDALLTELFGRLGYRLIGATLPTFPKIYEYYKKKAKGTPFCLVLVDVTLPYAEYHVSGYQLVCEYLRLYGSYENEIALIGNRIELDEVDLSKVKTNLIIEKPLDSVKKIQEVLLSVGRMKEQKRDSR